MTNIYERVLNKKIELMKFKIEPTTLFVNKKEIEEIKNFFKERLLDYKNLTLFCGLKIIIVKDLENFKVGV